MIRQLSQCPYCQKCEVALDDTPEVVFNPEVGNSQPCPHLIWVDGRYSQWELGHLGVPRQIGSIEFHWEHPEFSALEPAHSFAEYLRELVNSGKDWGFAPSVPFEIKEMWADEKAVTPKGRSYSAWEVDGHALFAQNAQAFLAALPACLQQQSAAFEIKKGDQPS
jgi:hypothetical protein